MLYLYIDDVDNTTDYQSGSLRINNEIQQRADSCNFKLVNGATQPIENTDLRIYKGDTIASFGGATVTLDGDFQTDVGMFRAGQELRIRVGDADEETVIVQSYDEATLQIVLEAAPSGSVVQGDKIGEIIFGGVVGRVKDRNVYSLDQIEYDVTGVDYSKIFDKKLISDSWEDRDSRYIINDFCNTTINRNRVIDSMEYENVTALRAEWIEAGDGDNPDLEATNYREGDTCGDFNWTFVGGNATFTASPSSMDVSDYTGTASGLPTQGILGFWYKCTDYTKVTSFDVRIGSAAAHFTNYQIVPTDNEWVYVTARLADNTGVTGTPDWTAMDFIEIYIVETADSGVLFDGFRFMDNKFFNHYPSVEETPEFDDIRSPQLKPTGFMQSLAKTWEYVWWIDYLRLIHFKDKEADPSPIAFTDTSDNFTKLKVGVDASQIGNRVIVRGGEKISDNIYSQAFPGDGVLRDWLLKSKFSGLIITIDDQSDTHAAEAGTNTTNIKVTGHTLVTGDYITNQTRAAEVREITYVDPDNFTVEAIAGQTNTDTITFFTVAKTGGVEGLVDETTVDYVYNSNEKSIRATESETTLNAGDGILLQYYERVPIQLQYQDNGSVNALKALGLGDGVFDLDPITDRNIEDVGTALAIAQARVSEFSNATILGSATTDQHGISAGQLLTITDSNRGIDETYVVQKISIKEAGGEFSDYLTYNITFGTTLFGWIEFMQKLLATQDKIELNIDDIVETYVSTDEDVDCDDVSTATIEGGDERATIGETVESADVNTAVDYPAGTWKFETSVGQPLTTRFDLADFG
jgi:hypothetical protein